ncbi:bifunctional 4-hydroxy-2-oxoglutarate aldolase/2-dehydro-3-deoxy-phosphogluconate aldolase [Chitinophaga nivalis]|uniref:Bifunctional 4-hydroxy-2-oxoglutarate aldolase/2-dehydro-3-deoxy-phosphogluconate aldolase n=1 Tax=Chitinophaga nivalis TaxID=2991709 RepID=A0ABT3ISH0_9BACT|nr:bifunctional 4-hydroxy-2-oxoglutarate aldolase/2-dehydro-3-deoxy-phosphogluconate aldolase [Chitinophaga nivalis]MCW3463411.1 bifunctional 4-hydroxy-2-oxoglutarate aldolase/2-dehydro-3-deoxy-phosphogluconate aldolase [Chitinophaga nivalis]MCW3486899.1 bifunctional 4-hydroxy-2-oxoglutarate aldolase/2-dehydro-3-deoxy-phosphogluconate aldolase [Chitinophaga nivalis]
MAPNPEEIIAAFEQSGIIPVFYHDDADVCLNVLQACYDGGLRVFEFTSRGASAPQNFALLRERKQATMPDLYLGIGTIKQAADAAVYTALGADFIVCPITDPETAAYCKSAGILWIPGCMTPSEIAVAEKNEAKLVKLFPGNVLGPGYVKAIKPLFPKLKFMPTGGVEPTQLSMDAWFDAGVVCVGMGSNLLAKSLIDGRDWTSLKEKIMQTFAFLKAMH